MANFAVQFNKTNNACLPACQVTLQGVSGMQRYQILREAS
jgi:hypothetical protein